MTDVDDIEWRASDTLVPYEDALAFMEDRAASIRAGSARECVWLLEHPPLFTAGTSADPAELFNPSGFPCSRRAGEVATPITDRASVGYVMLDLDRRGRDVRAAGPSLEGWVISTLAELGVSAHRADGRIGIWVGEGSSEAKIAALGIRIKRWVTLHGFAINVAGFVALRRHRPLRISEFGVTSLQALGKEMPVTRVDDVLKRVFQRLSRTCHVSAKSLDGGERFRLLCARFAKWAPPAPDRII